MKIKLTILAATIAIIIQFPETPSLRTKLVTKFGVSVEKVVATIENPNNHHGMLLPDEKNSEVSLPDFPETTNPNN